MEVKLALGKSDIDELCKMQSTFQKMYYAEGESVLDIASSHIQMNGALQYAKLLDVPYNIDLRPCNTYPYEVEFSYNGRRCLSIHTKEDLLNFVSEDELPTL